MEARRRSGQAGGAREQWQVQCVVVMAQCGERGSQGQRGSFRSGDECLAPSCRPRRGNWETNCQHTSDVPPGRHMPTSPSPAGFCFEDIFSGRPSCLPLSKPGVDCGQSRG